MVIASRLVTVRPSNIFTGAEIETSLAAPRTTTPVIS